MLQLIWRSYLHHFVWRKIYLLTCYSIRKPTQEPTRLSFNFSLVVSFCFLRPANTLSASVPVLLLSLPCPWISLCRGSFSSPFLFTCHFLPPYSHLWHIFAPFDCFFFSICGINKEWYMMCFLLEEVMLYIYCYCILVWLEIY